jgi:hypothetical protein
MWRSLAKIVSARKKLSRREMATCGKEEFGQTVPNGASDRSRKGYEGGVFRMWNNLKDTPIYAIDACYI